MDRCRVWESHADPEIRWVSKPTPEPAYPAYVVNEPEYETKPVRVVAVNKPNSSVDQMELVKRLLAVLTPAVPTPAKALETSPMDKVVQLLLRGTEKRKPAPQVPAESAGLETMLRTYLAEQQPLPNLGRDLPIYITGLEGGEDADWFSDEIAVGRKTTTDPEGGVRLSDQ